MRKALGILTLSLLLLSCESKGKQEYRPAVTDSVGIEWYQQPDTAVSEEVKEQQEEVKVPETPTLPPPSRSHRSSDYPSRSHKASGNNNMRGFDPASEDDMDDNGMSRYMENNDEEGWD